MSGLLDIGEKLRRQFPQPVFLHCSIGRFGKFLDNGYIAGNLVPCDAAAAEVANIFRLNGHSFLCDEEGRHIFSIAAGRDAEHLNIAKEADGMVYGDNSVNGETHIEVVANAKQT